MCLTIKSQRLKTKNPIVVYKVGDRIGEDFVSLYYNFTYLKGTASEYIELTPTIRDCKHTITSGYHAHSKLTGVLFGCAVGVAKRRCENPVVAEFEIPAGSIIYYNRGHNEIVSSQLVFKEFIQILDKQTD